MMLLRHASACVLFLYFILFACTDARSSSTMTTYSGADVFEASFTLPDDASPPTAAQVNPALEALGDRTKWLYLRRTSVVLVDTMIVTTGSISTTWNSTSYVDLLTLTSGSLTVAAGDIIEADFSTSLSIALVSGSATVQQAEIKAQSTSQTGSYADVSGAVLLAEGTTQPSSGIYVTNAFPCNMKIVDTIGAGGVGPYLLKLQGLVAGGGGGVTNASFGPGLHLVIKHWRNTAGL